MLKLDKINITILLVIFSLLIAGSANACVSENNDGERSRLSSFSRLLKSPAIQSAHLEHSNINSHQQASVSLHEHKNDMDVNCQCCDQCDDENCLGCSGDCASNFSFISYFSFIPSSVDNYLQPNYSPFIYLPPPLQVFRHPPKRLV